MSAHAWTMTGAPGIARCTRCGAVGAVRDDGPSFAYPTGDGVHFSRREPPCSPLPNGSVRITKLRVFDVVPRPAETEAEDAEPETPAQGELFR